jgi:hypothetical protein
MAAFIDGALPAPLAAAALIGALAVAGAGCSFIFSEGPPPAHSELATFDCGDSRAPPIVDAVAAAGFALLSYSTAASVDQTTGADDRRQARVGAVVFAGASVLDLASAVFGFSTSARCREAKRMRALDLETARRLPWPYGEPPEGEPPPTWPPSPTAPPTAPVLAPPTAPSR